MTLEKLISEGKKGVAALGVLGMLGSLGCSTLNKKEITTLAREVLAEKGTSELERYAGRLLLSAGTMKYQKELAETERTQIVPENYTIYGDGYIPKEGYTWKNPKDPKDSRVKKIFGSGFAFSWVDYNRSGSFDNAKELVELKSRFKSGESIALVLLYEAKKPFLQKLTICSSEGDMVAEWYLNPKTNYYALKLLKYKGVEESLNKLKDQDYIEKIKLRGKEKTGLILGLDTDFINWFLRLYGEGEYSAAWSVNGKIMDSITFNIIHQKIKKHLKTGF